MFRVLINVSFDILQDAKKKNVPPCDLYYDMKYTLPYLTFSNFDNGMFS